MGAEENDFEQFFRGNFTTTVGWLFSAGFRLQDAQDATAEAMVKARVEWGTLTSPRAWVRTVAWRHAVALARRTSSDRRKAQRREQMSRPATDLDRAEDREQKDLVMELLGLLPRKQRWVMALTVDGYAVAEVADLLEMSPATVRSNLRHARATLREECARRNISVDGEGR